MKRFMYLAFVVLFSIVASHTFTSCNATQQKKKDPVSAAYKINYDSMCVVGKSYIICAIPIDENDPFDNMRPQHSVVISKKINSYVQYYEIGLPTLFSRSCEEFIQLTKNCN